MFHMSERRRDLALPTTDRNSTDRRRWTHTRIRNRLRNLQALRAAVASEAAQHRLCRTLCWSPLISVEMEHCFAHRLSCHRALRLSDARVLPSACWLPHLSYSLVDQMAEWKGGRRMQTVASALLRALPPTNSHHHRLLFARA